MAENAAITMDKGILLIHAPLSFTVLRNSKIQKSENRIFKLEGISAHQIEEWYIAIQEGKIRHCFF
jgi:hypothetical protein